MTANWKERPITPIDVVRGRECEVGGELLLFLSRRCRLLAFVSSSLETSVVPPQLAVITFLSTTRVKLRRKIQLDSRTPTEKQNLIPQRQGMFANSPYLCGLPLVSLRMFLKRFPLAFQGSLQR